MRTPEKFDISIFICWLLGIVLIWLGMTYQPRPPIATDRHVICYDDMEETERKAFIREINDLTRERNYLNLRLSLANGEITLTEFENELKRTPHRYKIPSELIRTPRQR